MLEFRSTSEKIMNFKFFMFETFDILDVEDGLHWKHEKY